MKSLVILALATLAVGCASKPSTSVGLAQVDDVSLARALLAPETYEGATVRWGGIVSNTENKADHTLVFVVARALKNSEKPDSDSASEGRFVARFNGFVDPQVYKSGRPLTVVGPVDGSLVRAIGEYDYRFPIVSVRDSHLWAEPPKVRNYYYYPDPWLYHSFHYHHYPKRKKH